MRQVLAWTLVMSWLAGIFAVSSMPATNLPQSELWAYDKLVHFSVYSALSFLLANALLVSGARWLWALAIALVCVSLIGWSDEYYQSTIEGRHKSMYDWLADTLGGAVGACLRIGWGYAKQGKQT